MNFIESNVYGHKKGVQLLNAKYNLIKFNIYFFFFWFFGPKCDLEMLLWDSPTQKTHSQFNSYWNHSTPFPCDCSLILFQSDHLQSNLPYFDFIMENWQRVQRGKRVRTVKPLCGGNHLQTAKSSVPVGMNKPLPLQQVL